VHWDTRYSKIEGTYYIAQICPSCNYVQGDGFNGPTWDWKCYVVPVRKAVNFSIDVIRAPHVCHDRGNGLCNQDVTVDGAEFPPVRSDQWQICEEVNFIESSALPPRELGERRRDHS
jgi:hypothetical protein